MPRRKMPSKAPSRPKVTRPRDSLGRWLSARSIAAIKGHKTRAKKAKIAAKVRAFRNAARLHGQVAREKTEKRLTAKQRLTRKLDAARIERQERRRKKAQRPMAAPSSSRLRSSTTTKGRAKKSTRKRRRTSRATKSSRTVSFAGSGDGLKVQIGVRVNVRPGAEISNRLLYEAIAYKIDHMNEDGSGGAARHTKPRIIRWQNPGRKTGEGRQWRQGNQNDAWVTLGPAIRASITREYGF